MERTFNGHAHSDTPPWPLIENTSAIAETLSCSFKMKVLAVLVVASCWLAAAAQEEVEGGETSIAIPPCAVSHNTLNTIFEDLLPGLVVYVNCLSFDETGALSSGVVSGINETGTVGNTRFVLSCVEEVLTARPSSLNASTSEMAGTACVECDDTAATPCINSKIIRGVGV